MRYPPPPYLSLKVFKVNEMGSDLVWTWAGVECKRAMGHAILGGGFVKRSQGWIGSVGVPVGYVDTRSLEPYALSQETQSLSYLF